MCRSKRETVYDCRGQTLFLFINTASVPKWKNTFIQNAFLSSVNNGCIVVKGVNVWLEFVCPLTLCLSVCRIHVYTIGLVHPWSCCTCRWERNGESSGNSLVTRLSCWSHWPLGGNSEMRGERRKVKGRERASIMERKEDHCFPPAQPFKSSSPSPPPLHPPAPSMYFPPLAPPLRRPAVLVLPIIF